MAEGLCLRLGRRDMNTFRTVEREGKLPVVHVADDHLELLDQAIGSLPPEYQVGHQSGDEPGPVRHHILVGPTRPGRPTTLSLALQRRTSSTRSATLSIKV
jgi:hypothetical protein